MSRIRVRWFRGHPSRHLDVKNKHILIKISEHVLSRNLFRLGRDRISQGRANQLVPWDARRGSNTCHVNENVGQNLQSRTTCRLVCSICQPNFQIWSNTCFGWIGSGSLLVEEVKPEPGEAWSGPVRARQRPSRPPKSKTTKPTNRNLYVYFLKQSEKN